VPATLAVWGIYALKAALVLAFNLFFNSPLLAAQ
jgi:hypothetical protein